MNREFILGLVAYFSEAMPKGAVLIEVNNESWNRDSDGNWHFYINGEEVAPPKGIVLE